MTRQNNFSGGGQGVEGFQPVAQSVSDFTQGEIIALQTIKPDAIKISVSSELTRRKLYLWLWADASVAGDFFVKGQLQFYKNGSQLGVMPVAIGVLPSGGTQQVSLASVCVTGGQAGLDSMGLYVGNPQGSQPATVIMQPQYINGVIDEIRFSVLEIKNVTNTAGQGIRAWLGCISSQ